MRSKGSTTIQFGMVSIPVSVCSGSQDGDNDIKFESVSNITMKPFKQQFVGANGEILGKEYAAGGKTQKVERVYGIRNGDKFIPIPQAKIDAINAETKLDSMQIEDFVDKYQIDPFLVKGFDYLQPREGADNAFNLFYRALKETGTAAIVRWTPRSRQALYAIMATDDGLKAVELYFAAEIRKPDDKVTSCVNAQVQPDQLSLAKDLINSQLSVEFDPADYHDTMMDKRRKLIEDVIAGNPIAETKQESKAPAADDLMSALRASIEANK